MTRKSRWTVREREKGINKGRKENKGERESERERNSLIIKIRKELLNSTTT
jgi:hypothetical protein